MCRVTVYMLPNPEADKEHPYLYVNSRGDKRIRPFTLEHEDAKDMENDIGEFVKSYGINEFSILATENPTVYVALINKGYPAKGKEQIRLKKMKEAMEIFHSNDTSPEGGIIGAFENVMKTLLKAA